MACPRKPTEFEPVELRGKVPEVDTRLRGIFLTPACQRIKLTAWSSPSAKLISMLTPKRRWAQFSLLTMFLVVTVLCLGLRLIVVPAERQPGRGRH